VSTIDHACPAPAGHLAGKKETLLAQTLCELVNGGAEYSRGLLAHVLDRVDAKTIEVGVSDPILVTVDEALQTVPSVSTASTYGRSSR
jgi:hypothetical protein